MSVLSKVAQLPPLFNQRINGGIQLEQQAATIVRLLLLASGRNAVLNSVRHGGHERIFRRRQGQLLWNRVKDITHFYFIALGLFPGLLIICYSHIVHGTYCELQEYPKEGEKPPHYWQFERTPLRQFWMKHCYPSSDMQYHETYASRFSNWQVKDRWRRLEQRVKHLITERQDYKAYHYQALTNEWVWMGKRRAAKDAHYRLHSENTTGRGGEG